MMRIKPTSRILTLFLVMFLIFSLEPLSTFAENSEAVPQTTGVITAFDELAEIPDEYTMEDGINVPIIAVTVEPVSNTPPVVTAEPAADKPSFVYDAQPTSLEEVQAAIDTADAAYTEALASGAGFSAALEAMKAVKPHWQYEVATAFMPAGYHCEMVTGDESFGTDYYTFFVGAAAMTTESWGSDGIIVETEAEFRTALANSAYTTIYLGADITMLSSSVATVSARSTTLVINGTDPRAGGTRHTYKDYASAANSATLQGPCTNITFKDITVYINTYYGIYYPTSSGGAVIFDGVTGQAAQFYYGYGSSSTLVIKDSVLTLCKTHTYTQELVQNAGTVRFEGQVTVTREPGSYPNAYWDEVFHLTGTGSTVEIAAGSDVTLNNNVATGDYGGGAIFYNVGNFVVGEGASFTCYSTTGFADPEATAGALESVTIKSGADVRFICTTSHYWGSSALRGTNFTAEAGSNFMLYNMDTTASYGAFHFTNVTLNNPESFVILNPSSAAIGTNASSLAAAGVSSIRYYPSAAISGLFNTSSYAYMPTENYSKLWVQNTPFNVSATSWSAASPSITTNYSAPSASVAENLITPSNFSARTVFGIEIRGSRYTIGGTVSGLPNNSNLTITYTIDNGTAQTVTTDADGDYIIPGVPYGAKVVIMPPPIPQYYTLSPASITLDSVTAASTNNDFTYTKIIHSVTEKYVDEAGISIQGDTTAEVFPDQTYTFAGTTANIIIDADAYVYQGYKLGAYDAGDTLDGTGTPASITLTSDTTVHYVYKKLTIGSITIEKYGDQSGSTALSGVQFTLERWDNDTGQWMYIEYDNGTSTWSDTDSGNPHYTQTTAGAKGSTTFADLPLDKYRIQEVAPPTGYATLKEPIITEVPYTIDDTDPYYITVTGGKTPDRTVTSDGVTTAYYYNMTYTITDTAVLDMPAAGGGVTPVTLVLVGLGIALLAVAGYIFSRRHRAVN